MTAAVKRTPYARLPEPTALPCNEFGTGCLDAVVHDVPSECTPAIFGCTQMVLRDEP